MDEKFENRGPQHPLALKPSYARPDAGAISALIGPYAEEREGIGESRNVLLEGVNGEKMGLWGVHEHERGIVYGRCVFLRLFFMSCCAEIGPGGREALQRDGRLGKEGDDAYLDVQLGPLFG